MGQKVFDILSAELIPKVFINVKLVWDEEIRVLHVEGAEGIRLLYKQHGRNDQRLPEGMVRL